VLVPSNLSFSQLQLVRNPITYIKGTSAGIKFPQPYPEVFFKSDSGACTLWQDVGINKYCIEECNKKLHSVKHKLANMTRNMKKSVLIMPYL